VASGRAVDRQLSFSPHLQTEAFCLADQRGASTEGRPGLAQQARHPESRCCATDRWT